MPDTPLPAGSTPALRVFYVVLTLILVGGATALAWQLQRAAEHVPEPVRVGVDPAEWERLPGISIGREDAPAVLREFSDYQCPACRVYARSMTPRIKARFVADGRLRFVRHDFPLSDVHANAFAAARAARCSGEEAKYWEYHDLLYAEQAQWAARSDPEPLFREYAGRLGSDQTAFATCLRDERYAEEIREDMRFGTRVGVEGTPTLFLNDLRLPHSLSVGQLEALILAEVERAEAASP
jgi:protein-disulfide isomerase